MKHEKLLEKNGWLVECESPLEIRHTDGSFATMQAANTVLTDLIVEDGSKFESNRHEREDIMNVLYWEDPDDRDNGTNRGFEVFENDDEMLKWVNAKISRRPNLVFDAYNVNKKLKLKPTEIKLKYIID